MNSIVFFEMGFLNYPLCLSLSLSFSICITFPNEICSFLLTGTPWIKNQDIKTCLSIVAKDQQIILLQWMILNKVLPTIFEDQTSFSWSKTDFPWSPARASKRNDVRHLFFQLTWKFLRDFLSKCQQQATYFIKMDYTSLHLLTSYINWLDVLSETKWLYIEEIPIKHQSRKEDHWEKNSESNDIVG